MKKVKIISLLISVALISTAMVGCSSKSKDTDTKGSKDKSPVTLTIFDADLSTDIDFTDPVAKKITEKTGVTLKYTHPVGGDTQAIPLMIASGTYPDMIYAKGDTSKLVDAGALEKLDDYINKDGDNIKKLYGDQLKKLRYSLNDKSIYTVGTNGVHTATWSTSGTLQLQNAVLKDLNYPKIKTIADYENALKSYLAKNPTIDGQKTIGMSLVGSESFRWLITVGNPAGYAAGLPDDGQWYIDDSTQKATYKFELPEVKTYFKWMNQMNADGILDPEAFTQKYDTYISKLSSGRVLGISDANWDYGDATKALIAANKAERTYAPLAVTVDDSKKDPSLKDYGYSGGWGVAIAKNSKNKERAFQFLDWMASDEAQVLTNWGIEGTNYKVENGKRVIPADELAKKNSDKDYSKKTGVGLYPYPFPEQGDGAKDSTGNYYTTNSEENIAASYNTAEKETLKAYNAKLWTDLFPTAKDLGGQSKHGQAWEFSIDSSSDLSIIQKKADDYVQKAITQTILGKPADFDSAWNKIQSDLKSMGIQKADDAMTQLTKDRISLWNSK
ncbi:extracellular solute-binding protein [Clostridium sp. 19966]|uniref:ABC transporter substrate-binding protein n=1 Tax=Clostridium sp. 19966 TaxID=2768166 RepID=UPI0028DECFD0|nr:ABC transporter substrate-binding protein [Clostridium sp. 19966]MDT8715674.1 extracellular solute-binding protein [Clostridium sp. 19966]